MSAAERHRDDIDGLRAVAVGLVVAYHAGIDVFAGGYVGVDVFFVLSGFLITGILLTEAGATGRVSFRNFWARRVRRLLPLSTLVLAATLAAGWWIVNPVHRGDLAADARAAALYVANWRHSGQAVAYSDTAVTDSLLLHFWSLSIEEQFYVAWPLLVAGAVLVARRARRPLTTVVGIMAGVVIVVSFALSIAATGTEAARAYYLTRTRIWELAAGGVLATTMAAGRMRPWSSRAATTVAFLGLLLVAASAVAYGPETAFPGVAALAPVTGTMMLLVAGVGAAGNPVARLLSLSPMRAIGRWSYGIYLWHWPLIGLVLLADERWGLPGSRRHLVVAAVVAAVGLAALSHRLVEDPVRRSTRLAPRPFVSLALGGVLTAAVLGGAVLVDRTPELPAVVPTPGGRPVTMLQTPEEAVRDTEDDVPRTCFNDTANTGCVLGDPDGRFVVVHIGDSHARHFSPALASVADARGWRLHSWTKSACAPFDITQYRSQNQGPNTGCRRWYESVLDAMDRIGPVDLVIIGRSSTYNRLLLDADGNRITDERERHAEWARGVSSTFDALATRADRIIVMRDTPSFKEPSMVECLALSRTDPLSCSRPLPPVRPDDWMRTAEASIVVPPGVSEVDPFTLVCPTDPCTAVSPGGAIKYRDSHHLTRTFSLELADGLDRLLQTALR